jgi:hypothetical protein
MGTKLQRLVEGGCLTQNDAMYSLTEAQRTAIEALSDTHITAMIEVRAAVGAVSAGGII